MPNRGSVSVKETRLDALRSRHAALSQTIEREQRSYVALERLKELKKMKLRIKEELEGIAPEGNA